MWRRYIVPLIIVAVFAVLLLVVLLTQDNKSATPVANVTPTVSAAQKDLQILSLPASAPITGLEIKTITTTAVLKLDGNDWKQTAPTALTLDNAVVSDTVGQFNNLTGTQVIPPEKASDPVFGLDKPTMTLTLTTSGGNKVLNFGAFNQATNSYYVKLADGPKVWTVSSFYVNTLNTWLIKPPTPAPTIGITGQPLTPLPSLPPTTTAGATTPPAAVTTPPVTTAPSSTTAASNTTAPSSTTAAATTTAAPTTP